MTLCLYYKLSFSVVFIPLYYIPYIIKSVKYICSSRLSRASQSPFVVEKQLMPHAEYAKPTYTIRAREGYICISRGHSLLTVVTTNLKSCEDLDKSRTASINAFMPINLPLPETTQSRFGVMTTNMQMGKIKHICKFGAQRY